MSDRVVRESAAAICKMRGILGVHWIAFVAISAVCFVIIQYWSFNVGAFLWAGMMAAVKLATKKDPRILKVWWVAWRFRRVYDPFRRDPFCLVIVEDE